MTNASDTDQTDELRRLLPSVVAIAEEAGRSAMVYFGSKPEITQKADSTPVTEADRAAERVILAGLAEITPAIPVVSEEASAEDPIDEPSAPRFWLVDPLDGTREFIAERDEFTVNIALVDELRPVLGVVHAPARHLTYAGCDSYVIEISSGQTRAIKVRQSPRQHRIAVASRSHRAPQEEAFLKKLGVDEIQSAGSSLKFCLIAAGQADVYPRFGPTMEWDTAAGHAVLAAAGGSVTTLDGAPLGYGKGGFRNPSFVAWGG